MIALPTQPIRSLPDKPQANPLDYISASRLKSFLSCRLRFYFEKVLAIKKPVSPSLHFGKAVHAALQHYNKARWRGGDTSPEAVVSSFVQALDHPETPVEWDSETPSDLRAKGDALLRTYLESNLHPEKPAGVEVTLRAEPPTLALPLLGIVDLVRSDLTPVDYKTVAQTPNPAQEAWQHELQLTAYTLLIEDATGETCPGAELVFLVKTKTPKVIAHPLEAPTQLQRDRFARLVDTYAHGVANEDYYPSPGMQCSWCAFREECSAWKGGPS